MLNNQKLIVLVGPTGSGKSALALSLAEQNNGAIICADSRTIYLGMNIGTAKPSPDEQRHIKHYGLDLIEPGEDYSAADFQSYAKAKITQLNVANKLPFLVGGSGLYVDSVLFDYQFRAQQNEQDFSQYSDEQLVQMIIDQYPEEAPSIDLKNRRRLEQLLSRGPASTSDRKQLKYNALMLGLNPNREELRKRIIHRIDTMIDIGFIQEVEQLRKRYGTDCPQLRTIGYGHISDYLDGLIDLEQAKTRFARDDLALARRQLTWFKRNPYIHWLDEADNAEELVNDYLAHAGVQ